MEKKNTILLTVIAVATLLVAVVGATFAYFTATSGTTGDNADTGAINTAQVASVQLRTASTGTSNTTIYPGTMNYAGMSILAEKTGENATTDTRNYKVTYTLNGSVTLNKAFTAGDVTYTVYRTTSAVATPVTCEKVAPKPDQAGTQYTQSCTLASELTGEGAEQVAQGTVEGTSKTITATDQVLTTGGTTYYYYLVVQYENAGTNQNDDQNKTIQAQLTEPSITSTAEAGA